MGSSRRRVAGIVLALLAIAGTIALGSQPTGAQTEPDEPTVTVTPRAVEDGGTVTITTSGFPSGLHAFLQCSATWVANPVPDEIPACRLLSHLLGGTPAATYQAGVVSTFESDPIWGPPAVTIDCDAEPGGCVVGVLLVSDAGGPDIAAFAPISFAPVLEAAPSRNLTDGAGVSVSAVDVGPGEWSVAQCAVDTDPQLAPVESRCGTPTPVAVVDGTIAADVTVHEPLVAVDGTHRTCGYTACELVLSAAGQQSRAAVVSFGPPAIDWELAGPLDQITPVRVTLSGMPGMTATVALCTSPTDPSTCGGSASASVDVRGGAVIGTFIAQSGYTSSGGAFVDCSATPCVLVASSGGATVASDPLPLPAPTRIALSTATGLIDGDPITVDVTGLTPGTPYTVSRCSDAPLVRCESIAEVVSDADGAFAVTVQAAQRVGDQRYCRSGCFIRVEHEDGTLDATYAMAPGVVEVTPPTGLVDGQTLQIDATDLQPTYPGRRFGPFSSGVAAIAQCSASFEESPNLFTYFDGCAATAVPLTIAEPDFGGTIQVRTSITTFTGRQIDCSVSGGACTAGIARFEQDGSMTMNGAPLTFDG